MPVIKATSETVISLNIQLTVNEARILCAMMQNPIGDPAEETLDENNIRSTLFNQLSSAIPNYNTRG